MGQFTPIIASNTVEEVVLPEGLISIKSYSFARMRSLKSVFIPASVTSIEVDAFYDSPLLNAIFEDPVGWSVTSLKWDPEVLSSTDLADPERAAGYLCSEYYSYSWIKS